MPVFASDIVKLLLNTGQTLTGLTVYIKYKKPDGTNGVWPASICGTNNKVVEYSTNPYVDLDQTGVWKLQAFSMTGAVTRSHGKVVDLSVIGPLRLYLTTLAPTTTPP
jgi:hypothetical protein